MDIQTIKTPDGAEMVVLPRAEFDAMVSALEDKRDVETASIILARIKAGTEETFPADVVNAILDGQSPVKAIREHRHMTQKQLADAAGTNPVYLSQIERGERVPGKSFLVAIAKALSVSVDLLRQE